MEIKQKIIELLNRNLLLEEDTLYKIRSSIHELSEEKLNGIYNILSDLDEKQTSVLQEKLKQNPFFFFDMENKVFKEMFQKHINEELKEREMVEDWLLKQLEKY